jgi:RHS repeat-associated protein
VHSFTYDAENRVVSVDGGSTATYSYDHQNRRIKKTVGSTTTHYVWEGGQVIAEHNGSTGAMLNEYIFAGGRMIAREGSGRIFFLYDRLSVRATITDGQGNITGRQSHLPFGEELVATGTTDKHRFTSYERDSETGTDYAVNRQYALSVGRFTRPDPDMKSYILSTPESLNRYPYAQNDAVNRIDHSGLTSVPCSTDFQHQSLHPTLDSSDFELLLDQDIEFSVASSIYNVIEQAAKAASQGKQTRTIAAQRRNPDSCRTIGPARVSQIGECTLITVMMGCGCRSRLIFPDCIWYAICQASICERFGGGIVMDLFCIII